MTFHAQRAMLFALPFALASFSACVQDTDEQDTQHIPVPEAPKTEAPAEVTGPLSGSGLRFDGVYISRENNIYYLLRFFPQGNVSVINGPDSTNGDFLRKMIARQNVEPNSVIGLYNVPVQYCDDSLHFTTKAMRGPIDYAGHRHSPDSLRFLKHSHINGRKAIYAYTFSPDTVQ